MNRKPSIQNDAYRQPGSVFRQTGYERFESQCNRRRLHPPRNEVTRAEESHLSQMQKENLGGGDSGEPICDFSSDYETGSETGRFRNEGFVNELQFDDVTDSDDEDSTPPELENSVVQGPTRPRTIPRHIPRQNAFLHEGDGTWVGEESPPHRDWIGEPRRLYAGE